ncbi:murein DD-endopeptidase MepM/ murein hydrolase activator NlpD [Salinibacterium sp. CAN_S4]|uniref:peptidoglycan DD-metalloendopeptidase family protein n=1 Tax=Salinibacterium sp. CAN_S4 TaxID=2787727 RepID=UPI0018EFC26E
MGNTNIRRGASAVTLRSTRSRVIAVVAAFCIAITATTVSTQNAFADDYPTWSDVTNARNNQAATAAAVAQITSLLAQLEADAIRTQADAEAKGTLWQEAESKFAAAAARAATLQQQADVSNATAAASEQRAGQMAAQLVRNGGGDLTTNLLLNAQDADNLLDNLGLSSKVSEQAYAIYERAIVDRNTAQSQTDAADVAQAELKVLKEAAEKLFIEAQAASAAAAAAVQAQQTHKLELEAQLSALTAATAVTEASYLQGVQVREEARRAQEARDAAAAAAASLEAGEISLSGWVRPAGGYISSVYGWSIGYGSNFHKGTDLAAGCGAPIFAAASGTVTYAAQGWNGGYGNMVMIDHGNGVTTRYGHIVNGGILVGQGQSIGVGNQIARVGSTGNSTGCHLHFEVLINGNHTDPVPFMANQGISLG